MWMALLLATDLISSGAQVSGTVVDAATLLPVASVVITDKTNAALTNGRGEFSLLVRPGESEVSIQRAGYHSLSEKISSAQSETRSFFIRLRPDLLSGDPIEVTYEALKPQMLRQDKFDVSDRFQLLHVGEVFIGRYRVCIHANGRVAAVVALVPAGAADQRVTEGIRTGWQYKPLPQPACFPWNVELRILPSWRENRRRRDLLPGAR